MPDTEVGYEWWTKKHQRALDTLSDPHYDKFKIRITGQGGCGNYEPTSDPDRLNEIAKIIGPDPTYTLITPDGHTEIVLFLKGGDAAPKKAGIDAVCAAGVHPREVQWLWPGYFALGKLTIIQGDPGFGKSYVSMDVASRTSTGCGWPTDPHDRFEESTVVMMNAEDDKHDTIPPRLDSLEANCRNIFIVEGVRRHEGNDPSAHISLAVDLPAMEDYIVETRARLLIIDPLNAYMGSVDSHKDSDVRTILSPLRALAERRGVAVLAIMHLNKSASQNALNRGMGSVAYGAAARMVWLVCKDPDDCMGRRRLIVPVKANLKCQGTGLAFVIDDEGRIAWDSTPLKIDGNAALEQLAGDGESPIRMREAEDFLREVLSNGPMDAKEAVAMAREEAISEKTLRRAKKRVGVRSTKDGVGKAGYGNYKQAKILKMAKMAPVTIL